VLLLSVLDVTPTGDKRSLGASHPDFRHRSHVVYNYTVLGERCWCASRSGRLPIDGYSSNI
jgi:hypothetical protein